MNSFLSNCESGPVRNFLAAWSETHVRPSEYPVTLEEAQRHADAFMDAAISARLSEKQVSNAISQGSLRDIMVLRMREVIEERMSNRSF